MKTMITLILINLGLLSSCVFAMNLDATTKNEDQNIAFVTELYRDFFEKKNFAEMDKYFSADITFYKDFSPATDYNTLKEHLIEQGEECVKLNMLPFDEIFAKDNKVV